MKYLVTATVGERDTIRVIVRDDAAALPDAECWRTVWLDKLCIDADTPVNAALGYMRTKYLQPSEVFVIDVLTDSEAENYYYDSDLDEFHPTPF